MGKSRYVGYQCSLCDYSSTRRWNVQRHIKIPAHDEPASILEVRYGKKILQPSPTPEYLTLHDMARTNLSPSSLMPEPAVTPSQKDSDFLKSFSNEIEPWIKLYEIFGRLERLRFGQGNSSFASTWPTEWSRIPTQAATSIPAGNDFQEVGYNRPIAYRGYICVKCYNHGIVEFGITFQGDKATSIYGGICNHSCSGQAKAADPERQFNYACSQLNTQLYDVLVKLTGDNLYLFAKEISVENFQAREEFNPINFGQMKHDDTLYSIIKDGPVNVKVDKEFISDFFYKTLSTYCLASIEDGGKKRLFFLIILPKLNAS